MRKQYSDEEVEDLLREQKKRIMDQLARTIQRNANALAQIGILAVGLVLILSGLYVIASVVWEEK